MNEILRHRQLKRVLSYGIPRNIAKEIVDGVMSVSKGNNVDMAIDYAIDLTYGLGFTQKYRAK